MPVGSGGATAYSGLGQASEVHAGGRKNCVATVVPAGVLARHAEHAGSSPPLKYVFAGLSFGLTHVVVVQPLSTVRVESRHAEHAGPGLGLGFIFGFRQVVSVQPLSIVSILALVPTEPWHTGARLASSPEPMQHDLHPVSGSASGKLTHVVHAGAMSGATAGSVVSDGFGTVTEGSSTNFGVLAHVVHSPGLSGAAPAASATLEHSSMALP